MEQVAKYLTNFSCKGSKIKSSCCCGDASIEPISPPTPPTPQNIELEIESRYCCSLHYKKYKNKNN